MNYIFTSERLGFRNWQDSDINKMTAINADERVMEFFPSTRNKSETVAFIEKMKKRYAEYGFCYFAVEILATQEFIGFIGISYQDYDVFFNPSVDIGWRLSPNAWGKGYATEGAKRCLKYAFEELKLEEIVAVAPVINKKSISVMKKAGMKYHSTFEHPILLKDERIKECVLYVLSC